MIYRTLLHYLSVALVCVTMFPQWAHAADPKKGQSLFLEKCASCHNNDMKSKSTGPGLLGAADRWAAYPGDIYNWIRNSQALVNAKHPYATALFAQYNSPMSAFPELTDADIDDILLYVKNKGETGCFDPASPECQQKAGGADAAATTKTVSNEPNYTLWILFATLLGAVGLLGRYVNSLNRLAQQRAGDAVDAPKSVMEIILNPTVVKLTIFALVVLGGYMTVNNAIGLGRQQGYAPEQPIKFSHALHAGKNKIDCQYCHDGARRSKHSQIPAVNTCMNCHAAVKKGPQYGTAEIIKIYAAAGFNPAAMARSSYYFADSVGVDARMETYKAWLEETNADALKNADTKGKTEKEIAAQLEAIKPMIGKPIEWIRIHNLPDHVYFNHSQHVVAGGVQCQSCHGEVEKMEVVKQHSPLSMGWCVNCHRQTKVKFDQNAYYAHESKDAAGYKSYEKYHDEIKAGKRSGVTVEDIGGLECQKCHY